jgi:hypothetical protein
MNERRADMNSGRPWLWTVLVLAVLTAPVLTGCASSPVTEQEAVPFTERGSTLVDRGVRVTAAVPSAGETRTLFGTALYQRGIQPVWLEIENHRETPVQLLPISVDPDYFTPLEAAFISALAEEQPRARLDYEFFSRSIPVRVEPGGQRRGFVFTHVDEGTKGFNVDVVSDSDVFSFTFFIDVPGLRADHHAVDFERLYGPEDVVDLDEKQLIEALEALPCCATDKKGQGQADPLNIVVIGDLEDVFYAFMAAGWDETETIYGGSAWKTFTSFLFGSEYRYSPVSALYVFGRGQDIALQKARENIHERNHLRLWLTPMRHEGKPVLVGQISRDIGVRFTSKTITTHKIDPDVDETREYLLEDLAYAQRIAQFAYVAGVQAAPIDAPRGNLTGDPYFTDGLRLVMWIPDRPMALDEIEVLEWRRPTR